MEMLESKLRQLAISRWRWHIVTILTLGVLLLIGLPAVDTFIEARGEQAKLAEQLEDAQLQSELLTALRKREAASAKELAVYEERALDPEQIHEFRSQVVKLIRETNCQLRRIQLGSAESRPWTENDHPLADGRRRTQKDKQEKADYELTTQPLSLSVSGKLSNLRKLLDEIQGTNKLSHTEGISIHQSSGGRGELVMELQLKLFGLQKAKKKKPVEA